MTLKINAQRITQLDFNLHGLVGIRLLNPTPEDVAAVQRQLGPIQGAIQDEPNITIRFVDKLHTSGRVRYLGLDEAGFTDDAFLILRSKHKSKARVQIPLNQVGKRCELVCESGLSAVPLLIPIVNLTVLNHGALPLHASAFTYNGIGVLTTGWSKGGKTETLLAFMDQGAHYIGDEWVYITADGKHIYGIPEPIRVWDWHLQELPRYRALVQSGKKRWLQAIKLAIKINGLLPKAMARRVMPLLKRQLFVDMHPRDLFSEQAFALAGNLDKIFFVASHESADITIQPVDTDTIARKMVFSLQYERLNFMSYYLMFRFAFPDARNELIENAESLQRETLSRVLAGKDSYAVYHPYPVSLPKLFDIINPYLK